MRVPSWPAALFILSGVSTLSAQTSGASSQAAQELANKVNNPAEPVTLIQFRDVLLPDVQGTRGATNAFQIQPIVPIGPFPSFRVVQLMKITMPFLSAPGPAGKTGSGDLQVFDLVTIKQSWGRWGFGPALVFPTASARELGAGKWQAGPSAALMHTGIRNLTAGAIVQNPISYAGSANRARVNNMLVTPTLTYNFPDGWFAGVSDFNMTWDWENGGAATIPLGIQAGRVFHIGGRPFLASIEVGRAVARPARTPNPGWILGFEFSPIFAARIH